MQQWPKFQLSLLALTVLSGLTYAQDLPATEAEKASELETVYVTAER